MAGRLLKTLFDVIASEAKQSRIPILKWIEIATVAKSSLAMTFREFFNSLPVF